MSHRRAIASFIRARQELRKRLDRLRIPTATPDLGAGPPRVPVVPTGRAGMPPAAREAVLTEAREVSEGTWRVFGDRAEAFRTSGDWRAHPLSGHPTPLRHWTALRYLDGEAGGDVKQIWELNRHRGLLRLAQAWRLDRDPRWLASLAGHLDTWMEQNPPGTGINWASSLEVGFRALTWTWLRALTRDSDLWTLSRDAAFAQQLWHHGRHIACYDSVHHSPNTHLTGEAIGLVQLALAWPEWPEASEWSRLGEQILMEELEHQMLADGFHFELAPGYHRYTTEFYLLWIVLLKHAEKPIPAGLSGALERMLDVLAALRRPDGRLPALGDEDGSTALPLSVAHSRDPAPVLAAGAALFGRGEWLWGLPPAARDFSWWVLDDQDWRRLLDLEPVRPAWTTRSFAVAGYHIARERDDDGWWSMVDAGAHGGERTGHAHTDLGHVELVLGTRPVLADPGSLVYTGNEARRHWDRSLEAHATLSVAGAPLDEPAGPFAWRRTSPTPEAVFTTLENGAITRLRYHWRAGDGARLTHERQVALLDGAGVVIADWLSGGAGREVMLSWPLAMELSAVTLAGQEALLDGGLVRVGWATGGDAVSASVVAQSFADTYQTPVEGAMLRLSGTAGPDWVAVCWFSAGHRSLHAEITGQRIALVSAGARVLELLPGGG
jgi:hypothetical protein